MNKDIESVINKKLLINTSPRHGRSNMSGGRKWTVIKKDLHSNKYVYLMLVPVLIFYVVFRYVPMFGVVMAFQDYKPALGIFKSEWVGLENIIGFLTGPYAWRVVRNTLLINIYQLIFAFPCPIVFALLLNELNSRIYKKVVQTISYMPHFISLVVVCGLIRIFTQTNGTINAIASVFRVDFGNLLSRASYFRTIYVVSGIWQSIGWGSIIYIATLSSVDPNLHEAAAIDGAGRFRRIWNVTLPALIPIITVQLIMQLGRIMSEGYEKVILLYNPSIYETADIISSYVYRYGLEGMNYSVGTAIGLFNSIINIIILILANQTARKISEESLW